MEKKRKIVGYISSFEASNQISLDIQRRMIERYCQRNHLYCEHIFCDIGTRTNRRVNEKARAEKLGLSSKKASIVYEQWEEMLCRIIEGEISVILVDSRIRVQGLGKVAKQIFEKVVSDHEVAIVEVGLMPPDETAKMEAVIYSHTMKKEVSKKAIRRIDSLYSEAAHQGWAVASCYIDDTGSEKILYQKLKKEGSQGKFGAVFLQRACRLNRNVEAFFSCLMDFTEAQVNLYTIEEGMILMSKPQEYYCKPQKVAVFDRARSPAEEIGQELLKEIVTVFCRTKTEWTIKGWFLFDMDADQDKAFDELLAKVDQYDMIFINHLASLDWETSCWFDMKKRLQGKPIFCMKEGMVLL